MYILSGKGTAAAITHYILTECWKRGVLFDDDLPEYTLDILSQTPSVSKCIREGNAQEVADIFNRKLMENEHSHQYYMLLCLTAHQLIPYLNTSLTCVNLWDEVFRRTKNIPSGIAYLGTLESLPQTEYQKFAVLPNHIEQIGDLIISVKRGYAALGENYAAHPKKLLQKIVAYYQSKGITQFFIACTDLHLCKQYLLELGVDAENIIDILEIAGNKVIELKGRQLTREFLDKVSDEKTKFRYKYLSGSDSPQTDKKTEILHNLLEKLPPLNGTAVNILDIGGSSTGHSITLAKRISDKKVHITLQDISAASLEEAKPLYAQLPNITASFEHGDVATFNNGKSYDVVLCLGVLLCLSADSEFERTVRNIATQTTKEGIVITRDCLTDAAEKIYMAFGGVIRNEDYYDSIFSNAGLEQIAEKSFIIEKPIRRKIKTVMFVKR
ncbi:hypothetical protein FACS1894139_16020 [Planctomycetales bacterium]|nr:hypothetical protein FACS1894107_13390 [Planctomycetales bacterium]GHT00437.1 hypothetical protein FACS1894108_12500 [Planctomycetales bacterium]GHT07538.1 hypothetical protein FACS1894139_16020 [Planctomycetales bacterium]